MSSATGGPLATIVDIDRRLVKEKLRTKGGRGFNAARMAPLDAARLVTAILASPQANAAADAVERYTQTRIDANGRSYRRLDKVDFLSFRAAALYHRGREKSHDEPVEATKLYLEALKLNCLVYKDNVDSNNFKAGGSERNIRNATMALFATSTKNLHLDQTISLLSDLLSMRTGYLDPIEEPVRGIFERIPLQYIERGVLHRATREIKALLAKDYRSEIWMDSLCAARIKRVLSHIESSISKIIRPAQ